MPIIKYGLDARQMKMGADKVKSSLGSISKKAHSVGRVLGKMFNPMTAAIGVVAGGFGAQKLFSVGDDYINMASQLEYLTGTAKGAADAQKLLYEMSQQTGTSMRSNASSITRFALASEMTGLNMEENVRVLGTINTLMLKTGTDTQEASAAMRQFGQALASGRLAGDEFRTMSEAAPGVMNELAKQLNVTRGELKGMAGDGKLTSEVLGKAFLAIADSGTVAAEDLPITIGRMWTKVVNATERMWDKINDETGILAWIATGIENLALWVEENTPQVVAFFISLKNKAIEVWPSIKQFFTSFVAYAQELYKTFQVVWPYIQKGLLGLVKAIEWALPKIATMLQWLQKYIEMAKIAAAYTPLAAGARAAGTLAGGGSLLDAGKALFDAEGSLPTDNKNTAPEKESNASNAQSYNVYVNQKVSKSDITSIMIETKRINARAGV